MAIMVELRPVIITNVRNDIRRLHIRRLPIRRLPIRRLHIGGVSSRRLPY